VGHDVIIYFGNSASFNDWDLWTLRHFFLNEAKRVDAERRSADTRAAVSFFEQWTWEGPGVVSGTHFEDYADTPERVAVLQKIMQGSAATLLSFGQTIPVSYLNANCAHRGVGAMFTHPMSTQHYCDEIGRMVTLLYQPRKDGKRKSPQSFDELLGAARNRPLNAPPAPLPPMPKMPRTPERRYGLAMVGLALLIVALAMSLCRRR